VKQLTKKEIIKNRARAMFAKMEAQPEHLFTATLPRIQEMYLGVAEATIEADEKAGVLKLIEEGKRPYYGDVVELQDCEGGVHYEMMTASEHSETAKKILGWGNVKIIYSSFPDSPVYQCKKD